MWRYEPQSVYRPPRSKLLTFELFPNSFYFLVGILPLFQLDVARYACITKTVNLFDHITKSV